MKTIFILANGANLIVPETTLEHLLAHPEVTMEILGLGASFLTPLDHQSVSHIDLFNIYGKWGLSGLVEVKKSTLFAFRKGRVAPSSVIDHPGVPASFVTMITKPLEENNYSLITAFCSEGTNTKPEPITYAVDPKTEEGQKIRSEYLAYWQIHALALGCTPIDGDPFESTWDKIIASYGDIYCT